MIKRLKDYNNGRSIANDDLEALQENVNMLSLAFAKEGFSFLVSGGKITRIGVTTEYTISPGVICFDGVLVDFPEQTFGLTSLSKAYLVGPIEGGNRAYVLASENRPGWDEYRVEFTNGAVPGGAAFVALTTTSWSVRLDHFIDPIGTVKMLRYNSAGDVGGFNVSGLGYGCYENWALCDGRNGAPNLQDRFPLGWLGTGSSIGQTGGEAEVTLNGYQAGIQPHTHAINDPGHTHLFRKDNATGGLVGGFGIGGSPDDAAMVFDTNYISSAFTGISVIQHDGANAQQAHNNMPPFMRLVFIMKIS